jgi:RNA polymerase sigma factor (sigma-70 family)
MDDHRLLREYVDDRSEAAFGGLTRKYVNLVYSSALRQVHDRHLAEDVTQAVFLILSQKAATIRATVPLSAWLHNATRYAAADARRARARRVRMEQKVAQMHEETSAPTAADDWTAVAPLLDEAVARLATRDRQAILLRYFEGLPLADVGAALGISPDAARMRLERAVLRMRGFFRRKGIHVSASAIAPMLANHATDTAPPDLMASVAQPEGLAPGITTLARSATRILFWNQVRQVAACVLLFAMATSGATAVVNTLHPASFFFTPAADPISATNQYFRVAFAGDVAALRALVHTRSPLEAERSEAFFQMYRSRAFVGFATARSGAAHFGTRDSGAFLLISRCRWKRRCSRIARGTRWFRFLLLICRCARWIMCGKFRNRPCGRCAAS